MVQIIENQAELGGIVEAVEADRMRVRVDRVSAVAGFPNLADDAEGESVTIAMESVTGVTPGQRVRVRVRKTGIDRYAAIPDTITVD